MFSKQKSLDQPLKVLMQRMQRGEPQDSQSTYFSQAALPQDFSQPYGYNDARKVSPHRQGRWPGEACRPGAGSQDSGVLADSRCSQESAPPPAALRTKSEALEQRIERERHERRQLERDVREALTVVAAHVQALPERWEALAPLLAAGVERAAERQAERADRQLAQLGRQLTERLQEAAGAVGRAADVRQQSDVDLFSAVKDLTSTLSEALRQSTKTADRVELVQEAVREIRAGPVLSPADQQAVHQLSSAAQQVTDAVSQVRRLPDRLAEELRSQQRLLASQLLEQLSQQAARRPPPPPAPALPPLAARGRLTSPVGTVRPQPCRAAVTAAAGGRWPRQTENSKEPLPTTKWPPRPVSVRPGPHGNAQFAAVALRQAAAVTPGSGAAPPAAAAAAGPAEAALPPPLPPPPPPPKPPPPPPPIRRRPVYSPESTAASLDELTGTVLPPAGDVYDFTWESAELCQLGSSSVRTYSRTSERTPASRTACSPEATIRRSVARPCRLATASPARRRRRLR